MSEDNSSCYIPILHETTIAVLEKEQIIWLWWQGRSVIWPPCKQMI